MPRLQALLECVGQALCEKGRKGLVGQWSLADLLPEVAKAAFDHAHKKLPGNDLRLALGECGAAGGHEYERRLGELVAFLSTANAVPKTELVDYLRALPVTVRQVLRRPSDPDGHTTPDKFRINKSEELGALLPPRTPRFKPGDKPAGLDGWTLLELRGLGPNAEVWQAEDPAQPGHSPAALKFVVDPDARDRVKAGTELFTQAFEVNEVPGVLPLRSVYLETNPPCLEAPFVVGYDLAGLMFDWKWKYDGPKPEAALKLIRRLASIVAKAHERGVVHRDLKPSNVLLHPTEGGKFTMWVSDFGWGQIEGARAFETKGAPRGEQQRLAQRGAATVLYSSPQQAKKEPATPTDDIHALGVIWYQLLRRDPAAPAPVGTDWVEELRPAGFNESQARVLQMCLNLRADKRPKNGAALVEALAGCTVAPPDPSSPDGSRLSSLANLSAAVFPAPPATTARGKGYDAAAAGAAAAAMLAAVGGAPISGGPGQAASSSVRSVKNSIGMTFVRVPAGAFRMGDDASGKAHEGPAHEVRISRPFYLLVAPVTQAQYEAVVGKNPSKFTRARGGGPDHPVESVTWEQAVQFCDKLSRASDEKINRRAYRLPTEAEWEYACRAGTTADFSCGDALGAKEALFAGATHKQAGKGTGPVAQFPANTFGLHDMHGNVQEWVNDWFDEYYYLDSPAADPPGPKHGQLRVVRSGAWGHPAAECRSAARRGHAPENPSELIGFRVVMEVG